MADLKIPEGYQLEPVDSEVSHLIRDKGGAMTIRWVFRSYSPGYYSYRSLLDSQERFEGRGWKQRLIDAAATRLEGIMNG